MLNFAIILSFILLLTTCLLLLGRFIKGPSPLDRALVLEVLALTSISALSLSSFLYKNPYLLDIILIISLIPFLGSIALAQIINRRKI